MLYTVEPARLPTRSRIFPAFEAICALAALGAVALFVYVFRRYAVDFPNADDYSQLLAVPQYFFAQPTLRDALAYLTELSIDHRILTLRVAALVQTCFFGGLSFTGLMAFGIVLLTGVGALLAFAAPQRYRVAIAAIAAILFLSPSNHEAQFWATGALQHFGVLAYALAGLYCLGRRGVPWTILAALLILSAAFTSANGLAALVVAAPVLLLLGRRREALIWASCAVILVPLYFAGKPPGQGNASAMEVLLHPLQVLRFTVLALGSTATRPAGAALLGSVLIGCWIAMLALRRRAIPAALIAWAAFIVISTITIAVGRLGFGDDGALISRYHVYSEALCLVTLAALLHVLPHQRAATLGYASFAAAFASFVVALHVYMPFIAYGSVQLEASRSHYLNTGHALFEGWPPQEFGDFLLERARLLGYFRPSESAPTPLGPASAEAAQSSDAPTLWITKLAITPHVITLHGIAPADATDAFLWLDDGAQRYRARLNRIDFGAPPRAQLVWATVAVTANAGTYRIGYGIQDATHGDRVYWTDRSVQHWMPKF